LFLYLTLINALRFYPAPPQIWGFFSTVLGIFGVEFVIALMPCNLLWLNADKGQGVKSCSVAAKHFLQAGQVSQD